MLYDQIFIYSRASLEQYQGLANNCLFRLDIHPPQLVLPTFLLFPSDLPLEFMLKRMASKFSVHLGMHKPVPKDENPIPGMPLSSPSSLTLSHIPTIPIYDHRGSMSTERTSASQDTQETTETRRVRLPQRPRGTYRLSDFIIQRTLGTGSFGRVHLGMYNVVRVQISINICFSSQ